MFIWNASGRCPKGKASVRDELKKIVQNRLFIGALAVCFIAMTVMTAVALYGYNTGTRGRFSIPLLKGERPQTVFVSADSIDGLKRAVDDFENRDEIYYRDEDEMMKEYADGGSAYFGKYDVDISGLIFKLEKGEITEQELDSIASSQEHKAIRKEFLPEYIKLYWPVSEYENIERNIEHCEWQSADPSVTQYMRDYNGFLAEKNRKMLQTGFNSGYDYGWENFYGLLSEDVGIFIALIIIFGLCGVFTSEYAMSTDALLLSGKKGRGMLAWGKIAASLIYTTVCFAAYALLALLISFAFLGVQGMNAGQGESHLTKLFTVLPYILLGCYLLCFITLAVSSVCKKLITSAAVSGFICILPFISQMLFYIENPYLSQLVEVMPVNMVFGTYISSQRYVYLSGSFTDIRHFFPLVAAAVSAVCLPVIYKKYTRHEV
ncbi:MAG: ABC transporter permease subunit [Clostridia bacterium]|nr:ABC transporter permease subunit [Clostridia bacterium]